MELLRALYRPLAASLASPAKSTCCSVGSLATACSSSHLQSKGFSRWYNQALHHPQRTESKTTPHLASGELLSKYVDGFLPWKLDSHCKNCGPSLLHLHGRHCSTALGLSIRNDDQDLGDSQVPATRESLMENVFQSPTSFCAATSRDKGDNIAKAEIKLLLLLLNLPVDFQISIL